MKLSEYARRAGVRYKTAWRGGQEGQLDAYQAPSGTRTVRGPMSTYCTAQGSTPGTPGTTPTLARLLQSRVRASRSSMEFAVIAIVPAVVGWVHRAQRS